MHASTDPAHRPLPRGATLLLALATASVVADALLGLVNPLGARLRSGLSQAAFTLAAAFEHLPLLDDASDLGALRASLLLWLLFFGPLAALHLRARPASGAARWLAQAGALPSALGLLAGLGWAAGVAPLPFLVAGALGVMTAGPVRRERPSPPLLAALVGCFGLSALHALFVSGPGMHPALLLDGGLSPSLRALLDRLPDGLASRWGGLALSIALAAALARALIRGGWPLIPQLHGGPLALLRPLLGLLLVAILTAAPDQLRSVLRCPPLPSFVTVVDPVPGTFALALTDGGRQLHIVDRDGRETRRLRLPDRGVLPAITWSEARPAGWPEELVPLPSGEVLTALVTPSSDDGSILSFRDADGRPLGPARPTPGCFVASAVSLPSGVLLGCEYGGRVVHASLEEIGAPIDVPGLGSAESMVVLPDGGVLVAPLWRGQHLVVLDPDTAAVRRRVFGGDFGWGAALDPSGHRLLLGRFQEGRLDVRDADSLRRERSVRIGFGVRDVVAHRHADLDYAFVLAAGVGRVTAVPLDGGRRRPVALGGGLRALALDAERGTLYAGGRCGVVALDLNGWLGGGASRAHEGLRVDPDLSAWPGGALNP